MKYILLAVQVAMVAWITHLALDEREFRILDLRTEHQQGYAEGSRDALRSCAK